MKKEINNLCDLCIKTGEGKPLYSVKNNEGIYCKIQETLAELGGKYRRRIKEDPFFKVDYNFVCDYSKCMLIYEQIKKKNSKQLSFNFKTKTF
jgi:hypothetical protein